MSELYMDPAEVKLLLSGSKSYLYDLQDLGVAIGVSLGEVTTTLSGSVHETCKQMYLGTDFSQIM